MKKIFIYTSLFASLLAGCKEDPENELFQNTAANKPTNMQYVELVTGTDGLDSIFMEVPVWEGAKSVALAIDTMYIGVEGVAPDAPYQALKSEWSFIPTMLNQMNIPDYPIKRDNPNDEAGSNTFWFKTPGVIPSNMVDIDPHTGQIIMKQVVNGEEDVYQNVDENGYPVWGGGGTQVKVTNAIDKLNHLPRGDYEFTLTADHAGGSVVFSKVAKIRIIDLENTLLNNVISSNVSDITEVGQLDLSFMPELSAPTDVLGYTLLDEEGNEVVELNGIQISSEGAVIKTTNQLEEGEYTYTVKVATNRGAQVFENGVTLNVSPLELGLTYPATDIDFSSLGKILSLNKYTPQEGVSYQFEFVENYDGYTIDASTGEISRIGFTARGNDIELKVKVVTTLGNYYTSAKFNIVGEEVETTVSKDGVAIQQVNVSPWTNFEGLAFAFESASLGSLDKTYKLINQDGLLGISIDPATGVIAMENNGMNPEATYSIGVEVELDVEGTMVSYFANNVFDINMTKTWVEGTTDDFNLTNYSGVYFDQMVPQAIGHYFKDITNDDIAINEKSNAMDPEDKADTDTDYANNGRSAIIKAFVLSDFAERPKEIEVTYLDGRSGNPNRWNLSALRSVQVAFDREVQLEGTIDGNQVYSESDWTVIVDERDDLSQLPDTGYEYVENSVFKSNVAGIGWDNFVKANLNPVTTSFAVPEDADNVEFGMFQHVFKGTYYVQIRTGLTYKYAVETEAEFVPAAL